MRLYHRGAAFCKTMRGIISKRSEKRKIRDHKHYLLAAKYELRRKLCKAFCKDLDLPSDMRDKHNYKFCPRSVYEFFLIYCIVFRGLASRGPLIGIKKSSW
ncbi:hypothetical protein AMTRI_Chr12g236530 [Amborella trichopoda]